MTLREKFFNNRICTFVFGLLFFAFYANGLYAFYWEYRRWNNMLFIALNAVMAVVGFALLTWFTLELAEKKYTRGAVLGRVAAAVAVFEALQWGLLYLINIVCGNEGEAELAANVTALVLLVLYSIMNILFFRNCIKRFFTAKAPRVCAVLLCTVMGLGCLCVGVRPFVSLLSARWFYPVYRLFAAQGGAPTDDGDIAFDFAYSTEKPLQTDDLGSDTEISLKLAKNEREGFQLLLAATARKKAVRVEMTDFTAAGSSLPVRVYREVYTAVREYGSLFSNAFADALVPLADGESVALEKNKAQAFYFETLSAEDAAPGAYTATLTVYNEEGDCILTKTVTASVWDFTLPETPASESAMGLASSNFWILNGFETNSYGWNGTGGGEMNDEQREVYLQYYNFLLEHRISPYVLPYDILDERADALMSDPRVTSFCVPYPAEDEKLVAYYTKISSNPVWAAKAYFYPIDEPNDAEAYAKYAEITDRLERLCPGYNMVTPFCTQKVSIDGQEYSAVEMQSGKSSILCAISEMLDKEGLADEMYASREAQSSRLWWYVCCGPQGEYNNFFIRQDAIQHRLLLWQQKALKLTGLLYWDTAYWDKANPWESSKTWDSYDAAGDGCLLYPGAYIGIDEPIGTLRLANITDGLEDYDYLTLAEKAFGRDWVDEKIAAVSSSLTEYTAEDALLEDVRNAIGDALAAE